MERALPFRSRVENANCIPLQPPRREVFNRRANRSCKSEWFWDNEQLMSHASDLLSRIQQMFVYVSQ